MKICVVCGVSFDPNGSNAICCSIECSKEQHKETQRKWREQNRERKKESSRKWFEQNSEHRKENSCKWREQNPEKMIEMSVRGYLRNYKGITNPPDAIIQLKKEIILTKRLVKELAK